MQNNEAAVESLALTLRQIFYQEFELAEDTCFQQYAALLTVVNRCISVNWNINHKTENTLKHHDNTQEKDIRRFQVFDGEKGTWQVDVRMWYSTTGACQGEYQLRQWTERIIPWAIPQETDLSIWADAWSYKLN